MSLAKRTAGSGNEFGRELTSPLEKLCARNNFLKTRALIGYNCLTENMVLYAIAYAIMNGMENLRFEEAYFRVLVFYGLFYKRNRKHSPPLPPRVPIRYRNTRGSLGELEITSKHSPYGLVFPLQFLVLPNVHSCFYNCMETRKMLSIS